MLHHLVVQQRNLGLADVRRTLPVPMHSANCKVWWRRNNGVWLFFTVQARPLSSTKREILTLQHTIHCVLPTLWQQFGEVPFLFQHDKAPMNKARSIQKWFVEIGVE